jgi:hypothetical protein
MEGWHFAEDEMFFCSCGETLEACPLFRSIATEFQQNGLPFDPRNFGTAYRLAKSDRLNRFLTGQLPILPSTAAERCRDWLVSLMPRMREHIDQCNQANLIFIRSALSFSGAEVFVDATKNPYRLRFLRTLSGLELKVLHLIRDFHGVVLSFMENRSLGAVEATKMWIREQSNILRITSEFAPVLKIHYEDLCEEVGNSLAEIHKFIGLHPKPFPGNFQSGEHHILGNKMRLESSGRIAKSARWKTALSQSQLGQINLVATGFVKRFASHPLSAILKYYLN